MGLDMYLRARRYVSGWSRINTPDEQSEWERLIDLYDLAESIPDNSPHAYVEFCVGYWRKANQVHGWFVNVVQGGEDECRPWEVSREHLEQLRTACLRVLADPDEAEEHLPPTEGFFFGSYDATSDWYRDQLGDTVTMIDRVLKLPYDWDFVYQSSW